MTNEEIYNKFGLHLKVWIKEKYKFGRIFCKAAQIKPSLLSQIIHGKRKPSVEFLKEIRRNGFKNPFFDLFFTVHNAPDDLVTVEDYRLLVNALRETIISKDFIIEKLECLNTAYKRDLEYQTELKRDAIRKYNKLIEGKKFTVL